MQDAFAYCADLVRTADRDRYIATLFAPSDRRDSLFALYAFNSEIARVRELAREPMPGEIRLQWWREVIGGERTGEAAANPVAAALLVTIKRYSLAIDPFIALVEAHRFDLYDDPMARLSDLESYARETDSALIDLSAQVLAGVAATSVAEPAGIAYALTNVLRTFPLQARRGQLFVPVELLSRHGITPQEVFSAQSSLGLSETLAELRTVARQHLAETRQRLVSVKGEALAAFLPVALVGPALRRLKRDAAFSPSEISPWRRQWLMWRAARNPARIAA